MTPFAVALLLMLTVKTILDGIVSPIKKQYPAANLWWFDYVAWVLGAVVVWFAPLNMFEAAGIDPLLGRILTALAVGGGADVLNIILKAIQGNGPLFMAAPGGKGPVDTRRGW